MSVEVPGPGSPPAASLSGAESPGTRAPEQSLFIPEPGRAGTATGPKPPAAPGAGGSPDTALGTPTPMSGNPGATGAPPRALDTAFAGPPPAAVPPREGLLIPTPAAPAPGASPVAAVTPPGSAPMPAPLVPMRVDVPNGSAPTPMPPAVSPPRTAANTTPLRPVAESAPPPPAIQQAGQVLSYDERWFNAEPGDTFQKISSRWYGSDAYADALQQYNRNHEQTSDALHQDGVLKPGEKVFVPPAAILELKHGSVIPKSAAGGPGR